MSFATDRDRSEGSGKRQPRIPKITDKSTLHYGEISTGPCFVWEHTGGLEDERQIYNDKDFRHMTDDQEFHNKCKDYRF